MNDPQPLVRVEDLRTWFPMTNGFRAAGHLKAVDGVSFSLDRGETLGLVGESGCGKTTLGRTLLYLYRPTGGRILFRGRPVVTGEEIARYRRSTAMVFQDPYSSLDPRMRVEDLIAEPMDIQGLYADPRERKARVLELMEQVGLDRSLCDRYPHAFSGGQRQRVGIARALATGGEFLVCDEPVSALDVSIQAQVINMFTQLQQALGLTYLFIAHDLLVVRHISHRIAVMYLGRLVELGPTQGIFSRPAHPYTQSLLAALPLPDPRAIHRERSPLLEGEPPSPVKIPPGCPFAPRCPRARERCRIERPELLPIETGHSVACHYPQ